MKLKILAKIVEKFLNLTATDDAPRADMYLPDRLLAMAVIFIAAGIACGLYGFLNVAIWGFVCAVLGIVLGIFAVLCWKNQTIRILSEDEFAYTTMFGNTHIYSFSDIMDLRKSSDSLTLFVADRKVHIESMAILSDQLVEKINAALNREAAYLDMSAEELSRLSDEELHFAVWVRAENIVSSKEELSEGFDSLSEEQRVFYAVSYLEMEVNNGGLCQFFVNSSRIVAPTVSHAMALIGATKHKELYDSFVEKYQINLHDLSSFDSETVEVFQSQYERYPFDEYDDAFYELEPLLEYAVAFVREHIEKF